MILQAHRGRIACYHPIATESNVKNKRGSREYRSITFTRNSGPEPIGGHAHETSRERIETDHATNTKNEADCEHGTHG